jgi:hypothetical protein
MCSNGGRKFGSRVPCPCVLQERALSLSKERVAMLPTQLSSVLHKNPLRMRSWYPPFAKNREGRLTSCVGDASEIKSSATRLASI